MDNYTYYILLLLLFLAIAIHNMYRLKRERDKLRKENNTSHSIISNRLGNILGTPNGGKQYNFSKFKKLEKGIEQQ